MFPTFEDSKSSFCYFTYVNIASNLLSWRAKTIVWRKCHPNNNINSGAVNYSFCICRSVWRISNFIQHCPTSSTFLYILLFCIIITDYHTHDWIEQTIFLSFIKYISCAYDVLNWYFKKFLLSHPTKNLYLQLWSFVVLCMTKCKTGIRHSLIWGERNRQRSQRFQVVLNTKRSSYLW